MPHKNDDLSSFAARPESVSDILKHAIHLLSQEGEMNVGHVLRLFGVRGIAFLVFALGLLNVVIFMIPGLSMLFGIPMILLAAQMVLGLPVPVFPQVILDRPLNRDLMMRGLEIGVRLTSMVEKYIRPRFLFLSGHHFDRLHGLWALVLAVMVAFPIPFVNIPPSLGAILLGLGLLQRDGLLLIGSYAMGFWSLWLFDSLREAAHNLVG